MSTEENVIRYMNNVSTFPNYRTTVKRAEVEYWFSKYSDLMFCRGRRVRVKFEMITPDTYLLTTDQLK